jgi:polysaccharide deacetylase 2 family uncharacterized protein YibQ
MPNKPQDDRLIDPFYPPPPARRGSFLGGPGIIFVFLILLIVAGIGIYGAATGTLGAWSDAIRQMDLAQLWPGEDEAPGTTPAPTAGTATAPAADGALVLTPMGPAELLAARTPPRSLHLPAGDFALPPVERYARPALFLGQKPRLAFIVVNLGHNRAVTAAAIADTPPEVTLSFSPYAPDLAAWIAAAQAFGHEVMLDLPLESRAYPAEDPGALGLLTALNATENISRLDALLALGDGTLGVATQRGDRFLTDAAALRPVLARLSERGFGFLITGTGAQVLAEAAQGIAPPPRTIADIELPHDLSRQAITARLETALTRSRGGRATLVAVQPYPLSIAALTNIGTITKDRGLALVPASALLAKE